MTWATFDGVSTEYTGVGTLTTYLAHDWPVIAAGLARRGYEAELRIVGVRCEPPPALLRRYALPGPPGVEVRELDCGLSPGSSPYAWPDAWESFGTELSSYVTNHAEPGTIGIVILNDAHFLTAAQSLGRVRNVYPLALLHSTAADWRVDASGLQGSNDQARLAFERRFLAEMARSGTPIYAVSEALAQKAVASLGLSGTIGIFNPGVSPGFLRNLATHPIEQDLANPALEEVARIIDQPFALWFGRATRDKGLDLGVELLSRISSQYGIPGIVMAKDFASEADRTAVESSLDRPPAGVTVICDYPFELPRQLMAHRNLRLLAVLPRSEPFGLVPSEFFTLAAFGEGCPSLLVRPADGLKHQRHVMSFASLLGSTALESQAGIASAMGLAPRERRRRVVEGNAVVERDYSLATNLLDLICQRLLLTVDA